LEPAPLVLADGDVLERLVVEVGDGVVGRVALGRERVEALQRLRRPGDVLPQRAEEPVRLPPRGAEDVDRAVGAPGEALPAEAAGAGGDGGVPVVAVRRDAE